MKVTVIIPQLPKMANSGRGWNWRVDWADKKRWYEIMSLRMKQYRPVEPLQELAVTLTRCSSKEPDFDGLVHGFKPVVDSLVRLGFVINDRMSNLKATYKWEPSPRNKGFIRIEMELPDPPKAHISDMTC